MRNLRNSEKRIKSKGKKEKAGRAATWGGMMEKPADKTPDRKPDRRPVQEPDGSLAENPVVAGTQGGVQEEPQGKTQEPDRQEPQGPDRGHAQGPGRQEPQELKKSLEVGPCITVASPRRLLDALIVLAVAFALPILWLIEKIIEFRDDGGDDEKKKLKRSRLSPVKSHLQREPPIFASMSGACCPVQHLVEKRKEMKP